MANTLGALVVRLGLDAADYFTGFTRAEYEAKRATDRIVANTAAATRVLVNLGVAGAGAFTLMAKNAIDAADHLQDVSERTGIAVEELNGLTYAMTLNGATADQVETAMRKLAKAISEAGTGNKELQELFTALGMPDAARGASNVTTALIGLAKAFPRLSDVDRVRVSLDLLGKSGEALIPSLAKGPDALRELISEGQRLNPITGDLAKQANEFNDNLQRLSTTIKGLLLPALNDVLPVLNEFVNNLLAGRKAGLDFGDSLSFGKQVANAQSEIGPLRDEINKLYESQHKFETDKDSGSGVVGFLNRLSGGNLGDVSNVIAEKIRVLEALELTISRADKNAAAPAGPPIKLPQKGAGDVAKQVLDAQLKDLDRAIKEEESILRDREHFLQQYYQDDQLSIVAYYAGRKVALDEAVASQRKAYADEAALISAFKPRDDKERIEKQAKLAEVIDKTGKLERENATKNIDLYFEQARAAKQFQDSVEQLNIALLNARGDTVGAGVAQFNAQFRQIREQFQREGKSTAPIDELGSLTKNTLELNKATQDYSLTLDQLGVDQQHIGNLLEDRSITELESLKLKSDATKSYISVLRAELETIEAIANASGKREDIVRVAQLKVQLEGLEAQGDLVAKKFTDVFSNSFADALTDAVTGTKSLSDAFKSMEKNIVQSISRIAANNIAESLFGKNGPAGGIGGIFSKIFGGGSGLIGSLFGGTADSGHSLGGNDSTTSGLKSAIGDLFGPSGSSVGASASLTDLTAAATSASAALYSVAGASTASQFTPSGGGDGVGWLGKLLGWGTSFAGRSSFIPGGDWPVAGGIPEFATGTGFAPGGWAKVHKDEIINLPRGSQVIPANDARNMGGGLTQIINVLPGASRATADQSALMAAREAKRAGRYA